MATPRPMEHTWPTLFREHAAKLSRYLQALKPIDNANRHFIKYQGVRVAFIGALTFVHIRDAIMNLHTKMKAASENAARATNSLREGLSNAKVDIAKCHRFQGTIDVTKTANAVAKQALDKGVPQQNRILALFPDK
ncbi:hypothetical protein EDB80DRAFT_870454 [Ilyonectria destructans]|nr:hypothetical protein EDB80DRAFT_870454 [Ilyonectria destructans]